MSVSLLSVGRSQDLSNKISRDYTDDWQSITTIEDDGNDTRENKRQSPSSNSERRPSFDSAIKNAYKQKNSVKSMNLHKYKLSTPKHRDRNRSNKYYYYASNDYKYPPAREGHKGKIGDYMKSIIYGGLDGIITLFAIVASITGSNIETTVVLILGFSKLIGDGISMGIGDFLSEKAEIDFIRSEYDREQWEFEHYLKGEIAEMMEIYQRNHITIEDAEIILNTMSKYPKLFINHMMQQELGLNTLQIKVNPKRNGCITFCSFLFFGSIPLFSYLIFYDSDIDKEWNWTFTMAIILTLFTLFGMGVVKGYYNSAKIMRSGLFVMLNGGFAAASAYFIGWGLSEFLI